MRNVSRNMASLVLVAALTSLVSCGSATTTDVSGTIQLNGKAPNLDGLHINIVGKDGQPIAAKVNKDGTFRVRGAPLGEARVGLSYVPPELVADMERLAKETAKGLPAKLDPKLERLRNHEYLPSDYKNPIPQRFLDPRTSGKSITVEAGKDNSLTWDVRR